MIRPKRASILLILIGCVVLPPAFAAHPLTTEDTGTQGAGNVEIENALQRSRSSGTTLVLYQPQVSYGATTATDLIIQPSFLSLRGPDSASTNGFGDTNLDAKWRFFGQAPLSLGVRAGLALPTGRSGLGLPHGQVSEHALLVATYDAAPFTIHGNLGVARRPGGRDSRTSVGQAAIALMWAANEQLILTGEATAVADSDPTASQWARTFLAGAIYTLHPGLDLDAGFQITRGPGRSRAWLVALTYRFAP